jgi:small conductance mechanosensitive channel
MWPFKKRRDRSFERMFETRSHAWAAVGLEVEVNRQGMRKAWQRLTITVPLLIGAVIAENAARHHIEDLAHHHTRQHPDGTHWIVGKTPVAIAAVIVVLALGWLISRDLGRLAPALFRRMDPATAGTVEFLIRLFAMIVMVLAALAVGGISLQALAVGGAFTAVVAGLAAQQTLGNLFAGMVLLSARPFRVGERIRLQAGALGGQIDGIVSSLGLLYTTLARGEDRIMIPNNGVLAAVVVPLREPEAIDVRVRLGLGVRPSQVQEILDANVSVPTRSAPSVLLEEIDGESVVVRVRATPERPADGARLADEIIAALVAVTGEHRVVPEQVASEQADRGPVAPER